MMRIDPGFEAFNGVGSPLFQDTLVIDVRTAQEFVGSHVEGAIHIPYDQIESQVMYLKKMQRPILLYSTYGRRSKLAATILKRLGFNVYGAYTLVQMQHFQKSRIQ
jgi:phage shock protein E